MEPKDSDAKGNQQDDRQKRERGLDKTLADSFPSSDPPSTIPDPLTNEPIDPEHDQMTSQGNTERRRQWAPPQAG
jgi:hypothetical protein